MLGAIIGDIVGSAYEDNNLRKKDFPLITENSFATDDSIMTLAVAECIQKGYQNNTKMIIKTLRKWGRAYPNVGYGGRFYKWIFSDSDKPCESYGNGAAMRISAVGWYANSEEEVKTMTKSFTEITHNHPEGMKGAEVTAMCVYYARIGKSKRFIKEYVSKYYDLNFNYEELLNNFEFDQLCQNTVPQSIYCFLISNSFEDCLRTTISIGGDCDTTAAIACSIAEAYYKSIDTNLIVNTLMLLPNATRDCDPINILNKFYRYKNKKYVLV